MATRQISRRIRTNPAIKGISLVLCLLFTIIATPSFAQNITWPKTLNWSDGNLRMYQPEIETINGTQIEARAALSLQHENQADPTFVAIRFTADVTSPADSQMIHAENFKLVDIHFSEQADERAQQNTELIKTQLIDLKLTLKKQVSMENPVTNQNDSDALNTAPPRIILSSTPAILLFIDGEPTTRQIGNSNLKQVVNTPLSIIVKQGTYYLAITNSLWYRANSAMGPWTSIDNTQFDVPTDVMTVVENQANIGTSPTNVSPPPYPRPDVIVTTEPTELIMYDGQPSWVPLEGMNLLYMSNTSNDVFLDLGSNQHYVLLGGRWYRGNIRSNDTSWESVANDALPPAFANIQDYLRAPEVMTHIAGTPQSQDALLDNSLPRTSKINLDSADFSPVWDGGPRFEPVSGKPELQYGLNTPNAIFKYEGIFYGCEQGVWYTSESLRGHWQIARYIPDIIYDIPVSNPHYNVTYVHIYETTPHAVYVGYTPGYLGSYIYRGSIVHGTGWHYRPWHKRHYYARPPTWGLNAHYDPFYGWGFSTALFRHYSRHGSHHRDNHYYANRQHTYWPNNTHYRIHRRYHNKVHSNGFGLHGYKQHYRRTAFRRDKAHPKQHNFRKNEHPARPASRLYTDGNKVFGPRANLSHREKAKNRPRSGRRSHNQQRAIQAIDTSPNYVVRNRGSHNKYRNNNNAINSIPQQRINRSQREKNTRQMQKQRQVRLVNNKHKQPSSRKNRHNTPTKIRSMAASQKHSSGHQQRIVARQKNQASPDIQPTRKIQRREQRKATDQSRTANHKTNNKLTAHKRSNNKQNARTKHMDSRRH